MVRDMLENAEIDLSQEQHLSMTVLDVIRGQRGKGAQGGFEGHKMTGLLSKG